ncbi:MAG: P1 family peptidase [Anaerolineae bacterium]|nr:P1 family peptidase [Anaerolineae bacterium]
MSRARLRDLGIVIGQLPTGPHNAITDVPGVLVGHTTLIYDEPRIARTGVTAIIPRDGQIWQDNCFAAYHSFNGCGELTGMIWVEESGTLCYPIILTTTHHVGTAHEAVVAYGQERELAGISSLAVVGETWDGWLNDLDAFHIKKEHVVQALNAAAAGPVAEGNVGGGTGMICHDFKGGIGTASRVVETKSGRFTVGVLVQANHGGREDFRLDGVPVGQILNYQVIPDPWETVAPFTTASSSILIIVATDAPLLPHQCKRLAQRATLGFARVGGLGHNGSGDIFFAFATGNHLAEGQKTLTWMPNYQMTPLFTATAEAVEEAILNVLTAAETMTGYKGRTAHALPLDTLQEIMRKYPPVS